MATATAPAQMSPKAKSWLSETIRSLRASLLKELEDGLQHAYRVSVPLDRAGLDFEKASKRRRLEGWADEQARGSNRGHKETAVQARTRHLGSAVKLVAATWLNRLIVLAQMEALGLVRMQVLTSGWNSAGFREFREFAPALAAEESEGYPFLLSMVFAELALDLPGLFGEVGLTALVPMPTATLRKLVETLQAEALTPDDRTGLWRDDTLLGWVYQFWNDPERESLDEKIREGGKIENHEIAAKTQLFTDRYMVEWMLQNSLGQLWFGICEGHGWTPEVVADGTLDRLEARRVEWRGKREQGEVELEDLMPVEPGMEERWKYWVPRELVHDRKLGLERLSDLKLLDPACGSGHFLVIAFDLLAALYEEEAGQLGVAVSREEIARSIVENNLHGIDIDPRAVQIAAAAVWLKLKTYAPRAGVGHVNLVASSLGLGSLPKDDPALLELVSLVEQECGLPRELTLRLVETLKGADYLGSLLKVGEAIDTALAKHEQRFGLANLEAGQAADAPAMARRSVSKAEVRAGLVERLERFVARHSRSEDLGLRLRGEQLAAGVRFIRFVREGQYHLVVGNPPYQGSSKMVDASYVRRHFTAGKAELSVAFVLRSLQLLVPDGLNLLLTVRGWMFIGQFSAFREKLLREQTLDLLGDFDWGAFEQIVGKILCVTAALVKKTPPKDQDQSASATAIQPFPLDTPYRNDNRRSYRKAAATLGQVGRMRFNPWDLTLIPGEPLVYWWDQEFLERYKQTARVGDASPGRAVQSLGNNTWFTRNSWETGLNSVKYTCDPFDDISKQCWQPFINGATGLSWFEPARQVVFWKHRGLIVKLQKAHKTGGSSFRLANEDYYLTLGISFSMIGSGFTARAHRFRSIFGDMGSSVFPTDRPKTLCLMNSATAKYVIESLNPGVHFQVGDVNRLPLFAIESANDIYATLDRAFTQHEQARETSVEFRRPGPSHWTYAQQWAQTAVDRPAGTPLPQYIPVEAAENPRDHLSFALGVALGRFGANGDGILEQPPETALPHGILFLSAVGGGDSLDHPAARELRDHGLYLRTKFFAEDHLQRYEKRPIYFPLSSEKKSFVAWISIHRWADNTLAILLADYLIPEQNRLAGELSDLAEERTRGDRKAQAAAHKRYEEGLALHAELERFVKDVQVVAERGAPCAGCTPREVDAAFKMDLDDGVMINSAALWPLLLPQWKDPKTWWAELCNAKGKKDYDWSHLAARYFPSRVDKKCQSDPSLAVAHGVFWKYHPEKAYQWELRLQSPDELGPDFRLDEAGSDHYRAGFERDHPDKVRELREAEVRRRERKTGQTESDQGELFAEDQSQDDEE